MAESRDELLYFHSRRDTLQASIDGVDRRKSQYVELSAVNACLKFCLEQTEMLFEHLRQLDLHLSVFFHCRINNHFAFLVSL